MNKLNYKIFEAKPEDVKDLLEYTKTIGSQTDNLAIDKRGILLTTEEEVNLLEKYQSEKKGAFLLVKLLENKEIIASASAFPVDNKRHSHVLDLGIAVKKEYWGRGIANKLMDELDLLAKQRGFKKIILYVRVDNLSAINLYLKKGFEIEGKIKANMKIRNQYFDDYYMGKILYNS
jgi:RimJ/RimL family protein N-acetyltransferase